MLSTEKRREVRLPLEVRVQLQRGDHIQTHLCGDLSAGGLFVRTEEQWRNGERVTVRIFLPGVQAPVTVLGEVVRGAKDGVGVRFLENNRDLARFCQNRSGDVLHRASKNILIAHANEEMRYFLRSVLAAEGYKIRECRSLDETIRVLKNGQFDLLVADPLLSDEDKRGHLAEWLARKEFNGRTVLVTEGDMVGETPHVARDIPLITPPVELGSFRKLVWNIVK